MMMMTMTMCNIIVHMHTCTQTYVPFVHIMQSSSLALQNKQWSSS